MKCYVFLSVAVAALLISSPARAEQQPAPKTEVVCATPAACDKLSASLETQVNGLKSKGFRNLSREEKIQFLALKHQLLAVENAKQEAENAKQAALDRVEDKLDTIERALSAGRKAQ